MEKSLYIIRHGETDLNLKGIVQGRGINAPLNHTGEQQAKAFYEYYKTERFDKIYTSTLLRTHQTVAPFIQSGIPWEQLAGLDEISWGIYEGLEQTPALMQGFQQVIEGWRNGELDSCVEGGETPNQLLARQRQALAHIMNKPDERNVLICMHGRAMRIFLSLLSNRDAALMDDFPHSNTALYRVQGNAQGFTIIDNYNIKHLEGLLSDQ